MELKDRLKARLSGEPKTREWLCDDLKCTDGQLRKAVRELRLDGVMVCSSNSVCGYWLGDKADTIQAAKELRARAFTLLREAARLDGKELDGQIGVDAPRWDPDDLLLNEEADGQLTINF